MCRVWTFVGTCIRVEYTYRSYAGMMSGVACDQDDFVLGGGNRIRMPGGKILPANVATTVMRTDLEVLWRKLGEADAICRQNVAACIAQQAKNACFQKKGKPVYVYIL